MARIHLIKSDRFGFPQDGYWGPLEQDNTQSDDFVTFFRDRRLYPLLRIAIDSGHLSSKLILSIEQLIPRLEELCGPITTPSLLHGDAQQNNFICTKSDIYVIDPSVYYGNREVDLALIDSWQAVPELFFDAYRELLPIDPGFQERRQLWRIPLYLAAVALEGPDHLKRLTEAVVKYS